MTPMNLLGDAVIAFTVMLGLAVATLVVYLLAVTAREIRQG